MSKYQECVIKGLTEKNTSHLILVWDNIKFWKWAKPNMVRKAWIYTDQTMVPLIENICKVKYFPVGHWLPEKFMV